MYRPAHPSMIAVSTVPSVGSVPVKRPRSPSPTPTSAYQHQYESKAKQAPTSLYSHQHPSQQDFKPGSYQQAGQVQVTYVTQPVHSFQPSSVSYSASKSPGGKYNLSSQSAFSTYPSHYAQHQKNITEQAFPAYQMQRMQQPGYLASPHQSGLPLQQQLQHASEKAGFNEEKFKMQQAQSRQGGQIQGQQPNMLPISLHQDVPGRGSIVTGFSVRGQAPPSTQYQPTSTQVSYPGGQPGSRPHYAQQGRYY